jgi:hypothetical protein
MKKPSSKPMAKSTTPTPQSPLQISLAHAAEITRKHATA